MAQLQADEEVVQEPDVGLYHAVEVEVADMAVADMAELVSSPLVLVAWDVVLAEMVIVVAAHAAIAVVLVLIVDVLVQGEDHVHIAHKNSLFQHSDHHNKDNASLYPPFS